MNELLNDLYELYRRINNLTAEDLADAQFMQFIKNQANYILQREQAWLSRKELIANGEVNLSELLDARELFAVYNKPLLKILEE